MAPQLPLQRARLGDQAAALGEPAAHRALAEGLQTGWGQPCAPQELTRQVVFICLERVRRNV